MAKGKGKGNPYKDSKGRFTSAGNAVNGKAYTKKKNSARNYGTAKAKPKAVSKNTAEKGMGLAKKGATTRKAEAAKQAAIKEKRSLAAKKAAATRKANAEAKKTAVMKSRQEKKAIAAKQRQEKYGSVLAAKRGVAAAKKRKSVAPSTRGKLSGKRLDMKLKARAATDRAVARNKPKPQPQVPKRMHSAKPPTRKKSGVGDRTVKAKSEVKRQPVTLEGQANYWRARKLEQYSKTAKQRKNAVVKASITHEAKRAEAKARNKPKPLQMDAPTKSGAKSQIVPFRQGFTVKRVLDEGKNFRDNNARRFSRIKRVTRELDHFHHKTFNKNSPIGNKVAKSSLTSSIGKARRQVSKRLKFLKSGLEDWSTDIRNNRTRFKRKSK